MDTTGKPVWQAPEIVALRKAHTASSGELTLTTETGKTAFSSPSGPV